MADILPGRSGGSAEVIVALREGAAADEERRIKRGRL
jgi:hypothetical protein